MFPEVAANLAPLTTEVLSGLRKEIKTKARELYAASATTGISVDLATAIKTALADEQRITAELTARAAAAQALADDVAAIEAALEDEEVEAPVEAAEVPAEPVVEVVPAEEVQVVASGRPAPSPVKRPGFGLSKPSVKEAAAAAGNNEILTHFTSTGTATKGAGEKFDGWLDIAESAQSFARTLRANSDQRFSIAKAKANYPVERQLSGNPMENTQLFALGENNTELTAAFCAPCTPYYGLSCMNTDRRPVFNSLPGFEAPRGCVSIYPSPSLSAITAGTGIWSVANENDPDAVKNACQTISCASSASYYVHGIYRCLTVKNLLAMTYPELVQAYLNRLAAATARLAEIQLLNAMGTDATVIPGVTLGYSGTTSILTTILNYLALYAELERWDSVPMEAWCHRLVLKGIQMDEMRRRRTDGGPRVMPSEADITALFASAGVNIHWYIDRPTWQTAVPAMITSTKLSNLPAQVEILIAPRGKFALMDRGELNIGVTGNNIYRDNASNNTNTFTYFFEQFEGIVDTNNCPAGLLQIPVCWNGRQIADVDINCAGV